MNTANTATVDRLLIAKRLAAESGIPVAAARRQVDLMVGLIASALRDGASVHLKSLGKFSVIPAAERAGRNLKTGEPYVIPAGRRVKFKPSKLVLGKTADQIIAEGAASWAD